jgi:hypothetical protein
MGLGLLAGCLAMMRLMLTRLSAITPRPTQRFIPGSPLYRLRLSPCRRLTTLMRPSEPVRHFWPLRNQRFFCSRLRSGLLVERLGTQTRLTPLALAAAALSRQLYRVRIESQGSPSIMPLRRHLATLR